MCSQPSWPDSTASARYKRFNVPRTAVRLSQTRRDTPARTAVHRENSPENAVTVQRTHVYGHRRSTPVFATAAPRPAGRTRSLRRLRQFSDAASGLFLSSLTKPPKKALDLFSSHKPVCVHRRRPRRCFLRRQEGQTAESGPEMPLRPCSAGTGCFSSRQRPRGPSSGARQLRRGLEPQRTFVVGLGGSPHRCAPALERHVLGGGGGVAA